MALNKVTYVDNVTVIGAENLNAIQDAIIENTDSIGSLSDLTTESKTDLVSAINEAAESGGSSVPTNVRQAMLSLFESAAYAETGLTDEIAVIESWASEVTSLSLSAETLSLNADTPQTLVATVVPSSATVTWSSSDATIATVVGGVVTGVSNGTCTITASAGDVSATCAVTVTGFSELVSISAVYTQSGTVYDTDSLDDLKADLVVTAHYDDSSTETVTTYTLSGTLAEGTSTITVAYGGKTTTFTVAVTADHYIETDGNAYINIGYNPKANAKIVMDYMSLKNTGDTMQIPIGFTNNATGIYTPNFYFYIGSANTLGCSVAGSGGSGSSVTFNSPILRYGQRSIFTLDADDFSVDGVSLGAPYKSSEQKLTSNITNPLYLFARNQANTNVTGFAVGRLYDLKIYENDVLVKQYVPAKQNGAYGVRETFTDTFYGNSGSGTITGDM